MGTYKQTFLAAATLASLLVAPARADVIIGVAGPMTGSFADVGRDIKAGVDIAVATVNDHGGVGGQKIKTVAVDDKCDADTGAAVANQLIGKGVRAVIGHACTAAALTAAKVYTDNDVLFISPAATNPRLTDEAIGDGVFRLAVRSDLQAVAIGDYLVGHFGGKRVAFVHDGSVYGQGLVEAASKRFAAAGGTVAMTEGFTPGERSQNNLVGKIQDAAVSAVVLGALQSDAAVIAGALRARGLDAALIGNEALALSEFKAQAGPAAEGTVFFLPFVDTSRPESFDLLLALEERQLMPTDTLFAAHAAAEVALAALVAGDYGAAVARLRGDGADTVLGMVRFDGKGDWQQAAYKAYQWQGDGFGPAP